MNLTLFEGCLRNRKALCRELALPDGAEEAAVIEAGYRRGGAALPDRLYGAFAFAFHDPESGAFFCARDPVGLQPFFYCVTENVRVYTRDGETLIQGIGEYAGSIVLDDVK